MFLIWFPKIMFILYLLACRLLSIFIEDDMHSLQIVFKTVVHAL